MPTRVYESSGDLVIFPASSNSHPLLHPCPTWLFPLFLLEGFEMLCDVPQHPPSHPTAQTLVSLLPSRCSWSTVPHVLLTLGCRSVSPEACKVTALAASVSPWLKVHGQMAITFGTNECALASQQSNKQKPNQQWTAGLIPNTLSQG